jgi:hypothetical protein
VSRKLLFALFALAPAFAYTGYIYAKRPAGLRGVDADTIPIAQTIRNDCRVDSAGPGPCYERRLLAVSAERGVRVAMGTLNHLTQLDPELNLNGHAVAHAIGIAAGRGKADVSREFASCTEILQSGCYHGVIQGYFETVDSVTSSSVNAMCAAYTGPEASRWLRFQCVHGVGHGLTMLWSHNLPRALGGCDLFNDGWDRESCYGGAFMENIINATAPHHPGTRLAAERAADHGGGHHHGGAAAAEPPFKAMDSTDLHYPCSVVDARYHTSCYGMQTSIMLHWTQGDMGRAAEACAAAPGTMRYVCILSLGRDVAPRSGMDIGRSLEMCAIVDDEYEPWCHVGVSKNFVDVTAKPEDGLAYCRRLSGERNKLKCYEGIGEQIATLRNRTEERSLACASAEEEFRAACFYGAQVSSERPANLPAYRNN